MQLLRTFVIVMMAVFAVSILTVETHANEAGPLRERWPTCVDTTIELATSGQVDLSTEVYLTPHYLPRPTTSSRRRTPFLLQDKYRGPPVL